MADGLAYTCPTAFQLFLIPRSEETTTGAKGNGNFGESQGPLLYEKILQAAAIYRQLVVDSAAV